MPAVAFPVIKLASLAFKQIGRPVAGWLKERARKSHFFRTYICMPPAQLYHWMDVNVKMRVLNLGKPVDVPKLNEAMAIDLGAQMLGEGVIFVIAAGTITFEYLRSANKEKEKENAKEEQILQMTNDVNELQFATEKQDDEIRKLTKLIYSLREQMSEQQNKNAGATTDNKINQKQGPIESAIKNAKLCVVPK
ncbi:putative OPA3-like protein [Nymphon striatum]|nr:putative OPA3-like protein [Nymphon striatum]